jgi:hypothetical protein
MPGQVAPRWCTRVEGRQALEVLTLPILPLSRRGVKPTVLAVEAIVSVITLASTCFSAHSGGKSHGLAEGKGFEPPMALATPVFKTGAINHSATPPGRRYYRKCRSEGNGGVGDCVGLSCSTIR